jgi:hypothetical protein
MTWALTNTEYAQDIFTSLPPSVIEEFRSEAAAVTALSRWERVLRADGLLVEGYARFIRVIDAATLEPMRRMQIEERS